MDKKEKLQIIRFILIVTLSLIVTYCVANDMIIPGIMSTSPLYIQILVVILVIISYLIALSFFASLPSALWVDCKNYWRSEKYMKAMALFVLVCISWVLAFIWPPAKSD